MLCYQYENKNPETVKFIGKMNPQLHAFFDKLFNFKHTGAWCFVFVFLNMEVTSRKKEEAAKVGRN